MESAVIDASVILALLDPEDALHASAAVAARAARDAGRRFVLPASVLAEVLVGAARQSPDECERRRRQVVDAFGQPRPLDETVAVAAATRRARHPALRLPDAVVIATADVVAASVILTGDKRWRGVDSRVQIVGASG